MPWLSDEITDWDELDQEERELIAQTLRDLGGASGLPYDEVDDDYYE